MKAYYVYSTDSESDQLLHAPTFVAAKVSSWLYNEYDWTDLRARRVPGLDDRSLTPVNIVKAGYLDACVECGICADRIVEDKVYCDECESKVRQKETE